MKRLFNIDEDNRLKVQIGYNDTLESQVMFTLLMSDCDGNESTQRVVVRNNSPVYNKCRKQLQRKYRIINNSAGIPTLIKK